MHALPSSSHNEFSVSAGNGIDLAALNQRLIQVSGLSESLDASRDEVESFIRECFASAYGARIRHFMPRLFSLRTRNYDLLAAFGLRCAAQSRLFLETYLDKPIDDILHNKFGINAQRKEIIEVGNLAAIYPGTFRWLTVALTSLLYHEGYKWVAFTGTATLRNGFGRLGLRPMELGPATLDHLASHEQAEWGSYYDHSPMVMVGDITYGYQSLLMQQNLAEILRAQIDSVEAL